MAACTAHKKSRSLSLRVDTRPSPLPCTEPYTPSQSERLLRDIASRDRAAQSPRMRAREEIQRDQSRSPFEARDSAAGSYLFCTSLAPPATISDADSRASSSTRRPSSRARTYRSGSESTASLGPRTQDGIDIRARLERMLLEDCCGPEDRPQCSRSRPSTPRVPQVIGRPLTPDVSATTFSTRGGAYLYNTERPSRVNTPTPDRYRPLQQHSLPLPVRQSVAAPAPRRFTTGSRRLPDHCPTSPLAHATFASPIPDADEHGYMMYASPPGSTPPSVASSKHSTPASSAVQTPHSSTSSLEQDPASVHREPSVERLPKRGLYESARRRPGFDADEASRRLASVEGYVSFQSVEGLGAPPDCANEEQEEESSKRMIQAQPWRWLW
ncbi:uncharacterized protein SCHCODRAFT_02703782 [Schizophyllum commune H4-8]|uniref:Uncharacterized protein n=1 Tax=Schizophyllum commune (strain H4-8 / FGSC 9210) TaxID=578458 RepID=D8QC09_SCHCM|nr:uncharacterized protein SCHCODRAFT_02703782 [Schizophyllum commune H4-8]KAI5889393.1 hypothetical protein SCHCODRAFT_02703782 [Schizophyllum commune H4-8]